MSQVLTDSQDTGERRRTDRDGFEQFDYHPIPPLAPITLFLGVCAMAGLIIVPGLAIGAVGTLTGIICLAQIRRSGGELGGRAIARAGLWLSILCFVAGSGWHTYAYATEVPEGHERLNFSWLAKQPTSFNADGTAEVAPEVAALDGKKVFIKGYMYPTRQLTGISEFVLVKDTGECCFGGNPKISDMLIVQFKDGMTVDHKEQTLVSIAGVFRAKNVQRSGELVALYSIDGTYFK